MDAPLYIKVLNQMLLPFLERLYPDSNRFMADNDPKHTPREATDWLAAHDVHWWWMPAESPDCNSIEYLWHELKEYNHQVVKPTTKQ